MKDFEPSAVWVDQHSSSLPEFQALVARETTEDMVPLADAIEASIPIYEGDKARAAARSRESALAYMAEWNGVLSRGAGDHCDPQRAG